MHRNVNSTSKDDQQLSHMLQSIQTLMTHVPKLEDALGYDPELKDPPSTRPEWDGLKAKLEHVAPPYGNPVLIATLYGPSGSGKSTNFRAMTGVDVPSGARRPHTYACAAAVPPTLAAQPEKLCSLFPGFDVRPLIDRDDLTRKSDGSAHALFYQATASQKKNASLSFILVDAPDFNSIDKENKEVAERMLAHAHLVVFVTHKEAYADRDVINALEQCCRLSGSLVYVFSKWDELSDVLECRESLFNDILPNEDRFNVKRSDGKTLLEFLKASPIYGIQYSKELKENSGKWTLDDIVPINDAPPLVSYLHGADGAAIIASSLRAMVSDTLPICSTLIERVEQQVRQLQHNLQQIDKDIETACERIVERQLPTRRLVRLIDEALVDVKSRPAQWLADGVSSIGDYLSETAKSIGLMKKADDQMQDREKEDAQRLKEEAERLIEDCWRNSFPEEYRLGGLLNFARTMQLRKQFAKVAIPEPANDWEAGVKAELQAWVRDNPKTATALANAGVVATFIGTGAVAADFVLLGGLGTFGWIAGSGMATGAAGSLATFLSKWGLEKVAKEAEEQWSKQRKAELAEHMRRHLAQRLFEPWFRRVESVDLVNASIVFCRDAVKKLTKYSKT